MKITDLLSQNKDKVTFSFEFIPPSKGISASRLVEKLKPLMEFKPLFVDVTSHRHEIVFDESTPSKGTQVRGFVHNKHASTLAVCESIRSAFDVEVMPHLLCAGFTKTETEDLLLDLSYLEYHNVMALRGDKLPTERNYPDLPDSNKRSSDLIQQIHNLNLGKCLDRTVTDVKTDFCIGAACYPEKYYGSPCLDMDIYWMNQVKSCADFYISQMFFDNKKFLKFAEQFNKPIIPGIKVLSNYNQVYSIPEKFFVEIPIDLVRLMSHPHSGVDWAVEQCKQLIKKGHKHLHFFTMNSSQTCEVLKQIL